jgi:anti-sigma B factor antagonist
VELTASTGRSITAPARNRVGREIVPVLDIQTIQLELGIDIAVLVLTGKITIGRDCKQLEWAVESLVREGRKKVILDMTAVTNIDSTGIGIIVMSAGNAKNAGGELRVAGVNEHVEQVMKMTNLGKIIGIYPTSEAAAQGF